MEAILCFSDEAKRQVLLIDAGLLHRDSGATLMRLSVMAWEKGK